MSDLSSRFPRFFVTAPAPCPYLPGRTERKIFTEISGSEAQGQLEALGHVGFRRSQNVAYRPACIGCNACVPVRVRAADFSPGPNLKKVIRRNADIQVYACQPWTTEEQFELLQRYLNTRHPDGGMAQMDMYDFADMVERTPIYTRLFEYREPRTDGKPGKLLGVCLTDCMSDGFSMVYSFYDPDSERVGLGNYIIAEHVQRARDSALPYVYLGYWIEESRKMTYKTRFQPIELLSPEGWRDMLPQNDIDMLDKSDQVEE